MAAKGLFGDAERGARWERNGTHLKNPFKENFFLPYFTNLLKKTIFFSTKIFHNIHVYVRLVEMRV